MKSLSLNAWCALADHFCISTFLSGCRLLHDLLPPSIYTIFRGIFHMYLLLRRPIPNWNLLLVLEKLAGRPFEPMMTYLPHLLAWKTAFLVAVTSATQVGEEQAHQHDPPYLTMETESVLVSRLHLLTSGLFSLSPPGYYPPVYIFSSPKTEEEWRLHTLDVKSALLS